MSILRTIYYRLPVSWRFLVRKMVFFPTDIMGKSGELIPPKSMIFTGRGDFVKHGNWFADFFKDHGLKPSDSFLDIGSGVGRMAIPLTKYLIGDYKGFDVVQKGVDWCNKNIHTRYPSFSFDYFDLFNDLYKSKGADASNFNFPYQKNSYDFSCAISVFTHMLPAEVDNYFQQIQVVLKPGGKCVATFFIIDNGRKKYVSDNGDFSFRIDKNGYFLMDKNVKAANVAFEKSYLLELIEKNNLILEKMYMGEWCKNSSTEKTDCFQDIIVMSKKTEND